MVVVVIALVAVVVLVVVVVLCSLSKTVDAYALCVFVCVLEQVCESFPVCMARVSGHKTKHSSRLRKKGTDLSELQSAIESIKHTQEEINRSVCVPGTANHTQP